MPSYVTRRDGSRPSLLDQAYAILRKGEKAKKESEPEKAPAKKAAAKKPAGKKTTAKRPAHWLRKGKERT